LRPSRPLRLLAVEPCRTVSKTAARLSLGLTADERDAAGLCDALRRSGWRQMAGLAIDSEHDDVVAVLIGGNQKLVARIDRDVSRRPAEARHVFDERQRAFAAVNRVHGDAVVAAIGDVEERALRVDLDLGGRAVALEVGGQG